jgi:membrane-associated PAP2 superfamily phosphatase
MSANPNRFMLWHAWIPFAAFAALAILLSTTDLDLRIADHFFYDFEAARWVGKDTWWARNVLHTGGRNVMRAAGIFGLLALGASYVAPLARRWPALVRQRRPLGFFVACVAIVPLIVGSLKQVTNVDCPWDLAHYGGERPFVHIFEDRPDDLPRAACFPGAHSSSGFALLGLYFLGLARSRRHARHARVRVQRGVSQAAGAQGARFPERVRAHGTLRDEGVPQRGRAADLHAARAAHRCLVWL